MTENAEKKEITAEKMPKAAPISPMLRAKKEQSWADGTVSEQPERETYRDGSLACECWPHKHYD